MIFKGNWFRELHEQVDDYRLADTLRSKHRDARNVEDIRILWAWIVKSIDSHELATDHEESVNEQCSHVQTHCLLVDDQAFVFVELLFEPSQSIRQEQSRNHEQAWDYQIQVKYQTS